MRQLKSRSAETMAPPDSLRVLSGWLIWYHFSAIIIYGLLPRSSRLTTVHHPVPYCMLTLIMPSQFRITLTCSLQGQSAKLKFTRLPFWNTDRDCTVHSDLWNQSLRFIQNTKFLQGDCIACSPLEKGFYWHRYRNVPSANTLEKGFSLFINLSADLPAKSNRFFQTSILSGETYEVMLTEENFCSESVCCAEA